VFLGYFTERPYQDRQAPWYRSALPMLDLGLSNGVIDPRLQADLYHRYFDEKLYVEEMGFDGVMLNEHHSTPFCMGGGPMNVEAGIVAKMTKRLKIILLGNVLPIWEDPLWLVEELGMIDVISRGRLVSGWVRGTGRESISHNSQSPYNWERFQEAHDFVIKAWTTPGPFRWEGTHFQYRYVNPWVRPYQQPHPQIWVPGIISRSTVEWCVQHRYPYVMLDSQLHLTEQVFDIYREEARRLGYEAGTQHLGYMFRVHVDDTEEKAYETGRKLIEGPGNVFLDGSNGKANPWAQALPGMSSRAANNFLPTVQYNLVAESRGVATGDKGKGFLDAETWKSEEVSEEEHTRRRYRIWDSVLERSAAIVGTPDSVLPKIRHVLESLRPGNVLFWHGDGDMTHEEAMRGIRYMGEYVLPAVRQMGEELELRSAFEINTQTNRPFEEQSESPAAAPART
jgi:alkanesulfonate monooxygenase SsuD/methylene tetrahydromethanopterin reductase-like flavin-dependent oxidoreductase (luciferase family)